MYEKFDEKIKVFRSTWKSSFWLIWHCGIHFWNQLHDIFPISTWKTGFSITKICFTSLRDHNSETTSHNVSTLTPFDSLDFFGRVYGISERFWHSFHFQGVINSTMSFSDKLYFEKKSKQIQNTPYGILGLEIFVPEFQISKETKFPEVARWNQ